MDGVGVNKPAARVRPRVSRRARDAADVERERRRAKPAGRYRPVETDGDFYDFPRAIRAVGVWAREERRFVHDRGDVGAKGESAQRRGVAVPVRSRKRVSAGVCGRQPPGYRQAAARIQRQALRQPRRYAVSERSVPARAVGEQRVGNRDVQRNLHDARHILARPPQRRGVVDAHIRASRVAARYGLASQIQLGVGVVGGGCDCRAIQRKRVGGNRQSVPVPVARLNEVAEYQRALFAAARTDYRVESVRARGVVARVNPLVSDDQREARISLNRHRRIIDDRHANRVSGLEVAVIVLAVRAYGRYRRTFRVPNSYGERQRRLVAVGVRRRPRVRLGLHGRGWRPGNRPGRRRPRHPPRHRGWRKRVRQRAVSPRRGRQNDGRDGGVGVVEHVAHARGAERGRGVVDAHTGAQPDSARYGVASQRKLGVIVFLVAHGRGVHQVQTVHGNGDAVPVPVAFADGIGEHDGAGADGLGSFGVVNGFDRFVPHDEREARLAADEQRGGVFDRQQDGVAGFVVAVRIRGDYGYAGHRRTRRIPNREIERQSRRIAVGVRRRPSVRARRDFLRRGAGDSPRGRGPRHALRQRRGRERVADRAIAARRLRQDDGRRGGVQIPQLAVHPRRAEAWGGVVDPMRRCVGYGVSPKRRRVRERIGARERPQTAAFAKRKRGNAHAVPVQIVRRHHVAEYVPVASGVFGGVRHAPRIGADGEREIWIPRKLRAAVDIDRNGDGLACLVVAAGRRGRRESHAGHGGRGFFHNFQRE